MFTCERCHRNKPDLECVRLHGGVSFVTGLMVPPAVSVVCRRCALRVRKLGIVAVVGLTVIGIIAFVVLHLAADYM